MQLAYFVEMPELIGESWVIQMVCSSFYKELEDLKKSKLYDNITTLKDKTKKNFSSKILISFCFLQ